MTVETAALAVAALAGPRLSRADAVGLAPRTPGLYALYVGKAEKSLNGRDVGTHSSLPGKTGSSTVRRSLAALLVHRVDLEPEPRNPAKPDGSANVWSSAERTESARGCSRDSIAARSGSPLNIGVDPARRGVSALDELRVGQSSAFL